MRPIATDVYVPWSVCVGHISELCNCTDKLIEMPFGADVDQRTMYKMGMHISAIWRIQLNGTCATAMRPHVKLL